MDDVGEEFPCGVAPDEARRLFDYANVLGVAPGIRQRGGKLTGERCTVVFVSHKLAPDALEPEDLLPAEVDVVEVGTRVLP